MPVLTVNTNVPAGLVPDNFKTLATDVVAKSLGKPKSYVAVQVNCGVDLVFGGTDEPAVVCDLISIGALSAESNKKHSKAIMDLFETTMKVSPSRIYIHFKNVDKNDIGWQSTTFADFL